MPARSPMPADFSPDCWSDPVFVADRLRNLGYPVNPDPPTDPELVALAGLGDDPALFPRRVDAACRAAGVRKPAGFSPSNVAKVSLSKAEEVAELAGVTSEWLRTGRYEDMDYGPENAPAFIRPYEALRYDAESLRHLVICYDRPPRDTLEPWAWVRAAFRILADAKETEPAYLAFLDGRRRYREKTAGLVAAIAAAEDAILAAGGWDAVRPLIAAQRPVPESVWTTWCQVGDHLELDDLTIGPDLAARLERIGIEAPPDAVADYGERGVPIPRESSFDRYYKIRPEGESRGLMEAVPNLPWIASILPYLDQAKERRGRREVVLRLTVEEGRWLEDAFGRSVLDPAQGLAPDVSAKDWAAEAAADRRIVTRMLALHEKLNAAMAADPPPMFGKAVARPKRRRPAKGNHQAGRPPGNRPNGGTAGSPHEVDP